MKIAKRLAGLLLSVSIVAGLLMVPASAADTGGLSADKASAKAGDTIVVTSEIPAISGEATTVTIKFNYNPTKLEYVSNDFAENTFTISAGGTAIGNQANHNADSRDDDGAAAGVVAYAVIVSGGYVDLSQGHKMTATFKVKDDATPGETTIKYKTSQLLIKNKTESFVPTDWSTSATVNIKTGIADPSAPEVTNVTDTTITATKVGNQKYMCLLATADAPTAVSEGWQDTAEFTGLTPNTAYRIYTFIPETDETLASNVVYTEKSTEKTTITDTLVTVSSTKNGTITVSPKSAEKGDRVTITVKPTSGYELDSLTVTDKNGNTVKLTEKGNGQYTFTMPASTVTVKGSFVATTVAPVEPANPFVDVKKSDYYYDAVQWAVAKGITSGVTANEFKPGSSCSRAQMVTFLWRAAGSPAPTSSVNPFTDVKSDAYYYKAVLWAVEKGITSGASKTTFNPNGICNRSQTVTFLWRAAGSPTAGSGNSFGDVASNAYYTNAVQWAVEKGITSGTTANTFSPAANCTRGQIVTFLYRYMGK